MSVALSYAAQVTVTETLAANVVAAPSPIITHNAYNGSANLTGSTTPPVSAFAAFLKALSTGTATIDLTSLTGTNGATVVGTGLKVQCAKFKNTSTNANNITIAAGASNGYNLLGASFTLILAPGQEITIYGNNATPAVASGAKTIDLTGTGSQTLECVIVLG